MDASSALLDLRTYHEQIGCQRSCGNSTGDVGRGRGSENHIRRGEPTLCPYLGDLLAASKDVGLTTCIVTNASGLTEEFLNEWAHLIDWIGLSIDASTDEIHAEIGRGMRGDLARQRSHHLGSCKRCLDTVQGAWYTNETEHGRLWPKYSR